MTKLLLFDVDGTLTLARKKIETEMLKALEALRYNDDVEVGFVGGSDLSKQVEQLGEENFHLFDWRFSENGLLGYYKEENFHSKSFVEELGEIHYQKLSNICLFVLSELNCPKKRGTFIEYRNGMFNISPIGRACSQEEREEFEAYDIVHKVRKIMIAQIEMLWKQYIEENMLYELPDIQYSIGGQISADVFPRGWDKTYCLQFVEGKYDEIHFFGDKTDVGGNDFEIFNDPRVIGHHVDCYEDTIRILNNFNSNTCRS
jgi:phosphomannomutase